MKRIIFKKISLPAGADADERLEILEGHINDLQNTLEVILDSMNERMTGEG